MLGNVTIVATVAFGAMHWPWLLIPVMGVVNAFIGFGPQRAAQWEGRGMLWQAFASTLPMHFVAAAVLYGLGLGGRALFDLM